MSSILTQVQSRLAPSPLNVCLGTTRNATLNLQVTSANGMLPMPLTSELGIIGFTQSSVVGKGLLFCIFNAYYNHYNVIIIYTYIYIYIYIYIYNMNLYCVCIGVCNIYVKYTMLDYK